MSKEKEEKLKALKSTVDRLEKSYGKGIVMRLGDKTVLDVESIPTGSLSRQNALSDITGLDCDELMPKYLVGANCAENSDLEGDATDIAVWIQKFGGKITGMISMIAVVLNPP